VLYQVLRVVNNNVKNVSVTMWFCLQHVAKRSVKYVSVTSGGFRVGGPEAKLKRGPSDVVIMFSQL